MANNGSTSSKRRVCFLTGGGDAPGLNAVVRGFVHACSRYGLAPYGSRYGFEGLLEDDGLVPIDRHFVQGILPRGGSVLGCTTRVNPFFFKETSDSAPVDRGPEVAERLERMGISGLILAGGDGTMVSAARFQELGVPCIGVPKTIDKDLGGTDMTVGFETAVQQAVNAIDALHATAESHQRVMLLEVMGRYAGWIGLSAGIAGGADVILIPEIPYEVERIAGKIRQRQELGRRFTIIVVAEGAAPKGGDVAQVESARPGHLPRLGGAGDRVMRELAGLDPSHECRLTVLGHVQRGAAPSAADRLFGTRIGTMAARLAANGSYGQMIALRHGELSAIALERVQKEFRPLSTEGELVECARSLGIELGA